MFDHLLCYYHHLQLHLCSVDLAVVVQLAIVVAADQKQKQILLPLVVEAEIHKVGNLEASYMLQVDMDSNKVDKELELDSQLVVVQRQHCFQHLDHLL